MKKSLSASDWKETVRAANPLLDVVREETGVQLTERAPGDFWGLCPFHDEQTPSFHVRTKAGRCKCHGCGFGGDPFDVVCRTRGVTFPQARDILAARAGLSPSDAPPPPPRPQGVPLRALIPPARWTAEEGERMQVAYAIALTSEMLDTVATDLGLPVDVVRAFGAGWCTRLSACTFPMRSHTGSIRGFRTRGTDGAKMSIKGSRSGLFFVLDLLDSADDVRELLVVEGLTDTPSGTILGWHTIGRPSAHDAAGDAMLIEVLRSFPNLERVVVVADADAAGQISAAKIADRIRGAVRDVRLVTPPLGAKDLRAALRAGLTARELRETIDAAPSLGGKGGAA